MKSIWLVLLLALLSSCDPPAGTDTGTDTGDGGGNVAGDGTDSTLTTTRDCTIFPADNPWNTDISGYPIHTKSAAYIASIGASTAMHADFGTVYNGAPNGIPFVVVPGDQPRVPITFAWASESDPGPYPIPEDPPVEGGTNGTGDRHILIVDQENCELWEIFKSQFTNSAWTGLSGAYFDLTSNVLRTDGWTSADAAGLPIFPGLVRLEEVEAGEITHALRFTVPQTQKAYIHPATHYASDATSSSLPPMGLRVRLKASVDISGFSTRNQVILTALKKYGMFLADNGSAWYLSGAPNSGWADDDLHDLNQIQGSDFEAVETGTIVTP